MARRAVIAAIGLDSTAVGVYGVNFRNGVAAERVCGFEENASVVENIGRKVIRRSIGKSQRLSAGEVDSFNHESAGHFPRIDHTILRKIERPNAIFSTGGDAPRL